MSESLLEALSRNEIVSDLLKKFQIETQGISCESLPENFRLNDLVFLSVFVTFLFLTMSSSRILLEGFSLLNT